MLELLGAVAALAHRQPRPFYETALLRAHAEQLRAAEAQWRIYRHNRDDASLHALWHHFTTVFYNCRPLVREMHAHDLPAASPDLAKLCGGGVLVPGHMPQAGRRSSSSRSARLEIIASKQRPRKLALVGSDGRTYLFLLKAHEDTRLDERVMQLFSVINKFVAGSQLPLGDKLFIMTTRSSRPQARLG
jgi:FKBP12-rapamycin complex-associated protein